MKGQTGIELAILGFMMLIGVIAIYLPPVIFKTSSTVNIEYEYSYDNSQLLLMNLLPTTVADATTGTTKTSLELLGEYFQLQMKDNTVLSPIGNNLKLMADATGMDCYQLSTQEGNIAKSSCDPSKYRITATIPLPYKPDSLTKTITLVVGK